jgi:hypothetical protein
MPASSGLAANVPGVSTLQVAHFTPLTVTLLSFWTQEVSAIAKQTVAIFKLLYCIIIITFLALFRGGLYLFYL